MDKVWPVKRVGNWFSLGFEIYFLPGQPRQILNEKQIKGKSLKNNN
jgi:hypothetical protein